MYFCILYSWHQCSRMDLRSPDPFFIYPVECSLYVLTMYYVRSVTVPSMGCRLRRTWKTLQSLAPPHPHSIRKAAHESRSSLDVCVCNATGCFSSSVSLTNARYVTTIPIWVFKLPCHKGSRTSIRLFHVEVTHLGLWSSFRKIMVQAGCVLLSTDKRW